MPDWKQAVTNGSCKENEGCGTASTCMCALAEDMADEIERLREALRYYAKNHYPDIDAGPWGPNSNDWGDVARTALGEKE